MYCHCKSYRYDFAERSGDKADGCAIFWNAAKLKCRDSKVINFSHLGLRDNVAQILVLENCSDHRSQQLVVANTHILFNPKRGEIKVAQVRIILEAVHAMCQLYGGNVPCMFMGDLNITPDSALYSFIASGQLDCAANDPRNLSGQQEARAGRQAYTPSPSNRRSPHASQGARRRRTPPMQPMHQSPRPVVAQASHTVHTRFGRHALEDMISMGRASVAAPMPLHPNTPVSSTVPSTNAAAGVRYPPGLHLPQQEFEATSASRVTTGSNMHSIKKVKLDSNGLIAVEHSNNVTAEQPVHPQLQLQSPAAVLSADAAQFQQQGLPPLRLAPASAEVCGVAQHQQQGSPHSFPQAPSTEVLGGLMLQVQEDRRPMSPLLQSAARSVPPPPHYQPCVDRAPLRVPRLAPATDCGNINWTDYEAAPSTRRMSSGQRGGMDQQQLAIAHTQETHDPSAAIDNMLQHPLRLQSAYMEVAGSEPEFTSCHDRFCGTVDYIWYTPQVGSANVRPVAVLNPPCQQFVSRGLPTADFPSDHVSVVCDFQIFCQPSFSEQSKQHD
ncbi:TPA: Protein angel 1, variant 2 [Trebouxia sp. C0004]